MVPQRFGQPVAVGRLLGPGVGDGGVESDGFGIGLVGGGVIFHQAEDLAQVARRPRGQLPEFQVVRALPEGLVVRLPGLADDLFAERQGFGVVRQVLLGHLQQFPERRPGQTRVLGGPRLLALGAASFPLGPVRLADGLPALLLRAPLLAPDQPRAHRQGQHRR